jgi:SAM-dependent methyltransferase
MTDQAAYVSALIELHLGIGREGPGDLGFSREILGRLPTLPGDEPIADLGCGSGAASVLLAAHFGRTVVCVDMVDEFLQGLRARADRSGVADLTAPLRADMGGLKPNQHQFSLIWSEGAAYNLTFDGALPAWRPLLVPGGLAVVSELSWFTDRRPAEPSGFWDAAYPAMGGEGENIETAERQGFEVLFVERLPAEAWWPNYYTPLLAGADRLEAQASPVMQDVITELRREAGLFRRFSDDYGYAFYVLRRPG